MNCKNSIIVLQFKYGLQDLFSSVLEIDTNSNSFKFFQSTLALQPHTYVHTGIRLVRIINMSQADLSHF